MPPFLLWFVNTKLGRTVGAALLIVIAVVASWYFFSTHYYNAGVKACEAKQLADVNKSNVAQGEQNKANNLASGAVAKDADKKQQQLTDAASKDNQTAKGEVHDIYKKPPATAPVRLGSCVHPVDDSVQRRIDEARAAAVEARGT